MDNSAGITYLLSSISSKNGVPLSTLKLNARILERLGLIEFDGSPAKVTAIGELILEITRGEASE